MRIIFVCFLFFFLTAPSKGQVTDSTLLSDIVSAENLIETNVPAALELITAAYIHSRELHFDLGIARSYLVVGRCYIQTGDYEAAEKALSIALKYADNIQDQALLSDCYFYLGSACSITSNTKLQLSWYNRSYAIRKKLTDKRRLADNYHAFGNLYLHLKQDSLAESYFLLAKEIRTALHDLPGLAALFNNLAIIAGNRKDTLTYRKLIVQAIVMNEKAGNRRHLATNHGNLGLSYLAEGKFDSAWHHCYRAFLIRKENDFKDHLSGSYQDLGDILFRQKKYTEALVYYKQSAAVAKQICGYDWMTRSYYSLAETYAALDSLELKKKYTAMAHQLTKEREADTLLSRKIPLPPAFDFEGPRNQMPWMWWAGGFFVLTLASLLFYRIRK